MHGKNATMIGQEHIDPEFAAWVWHMAPWSLAWRWGLAEEKEKKEDKMANTIWEIMPDHVSECMAPLEKSKTELWENMLACMRESLSE